MPLAAPKPCSAPQCRALRAPGSRFCTSHVGREQMENRREREPDAFLYSSAWRGLRAVFLRRHPLCTCGAPAKHVDHIVSRKAAPSLALDWRNLQALCVPCHTRKTNAVDGSGWHAAAHHPGVKSYTPPPATDRALVTHERWHNPKIGGPHRG